MVDNNFFTIIKGKREDYHFHSEVEVIFVVEGQIDLKIKDVVQTLMREDIVLVNSGVLHEIKCSDDAIYCKASYSYDMLTEILQESYIMFFCNSITDGNNSYAKLKSIFHNLIYEYIRKSRKTLCMQNSLLLTLLDCLIENFLIDTKEYSADESDLRLQTIYQYVNKNFKVGVSLSDLADEMYVSTSTLSRFFKKQTGLYFSDYVNRVKCRYAIHELLYTHKNITKIAMDGGFSNPSAFNKIFRDLYGVSPSEYRKAKRMEDKSQHIENDDELSLRKELILKEPYLNPSVHVQPEKHVKVSDRNPGNDYIHSWNKVINVGSAENLTMASVQAHALMMTEAIGYSHLRIWNVFAKNMMITDGKSIGDYNYDMLDTVLDFIVNNRLHPYIDFGRRPDAIIKSENQPMLWQDKGIDFQSEEIWRAAFEDFIKHIISRYGKDEVNQWIFEVSFDRNHIKDNQYFMGNGADHVEQFRVYGYIYNTIKGLCPDALVGGPGGVVDVNQQFLEKFLRLCIESDNIPDFVSFILFPYETHMENDTPITYRSTDRKNAIHMVEDIQGIVSKLGLKDTPLYVTECNNTIACRNYLNDSCYRAAYYVNLIAEIGEKVDMVAPWIVSDWVSNYYDFRGLVVGGPGIISKDSIKKPAFYALEYMEYLGNKILAQGDNYIVTKKGEDYYIACFNYKWYGVNYFVDDNANMSIEKINEVFENKDELRLSFGIEDMDKDTEYVIKMRTVNSEHGSILNEWKTLSYETKLTGPDIQYIKHRCIPGIQIEKKKAVNRVLEFSKVLEPHEVTFIHIYK